MVVNKIDLLGEHKSNGTISDVPNVIFISAKKQRHTEVLKESLVDTVLSGNVQSESTIATNARHDHALKEVEKSLNDISDGFSKKLSGDLLALDKGGVCIIWVRSLAR